MTLSNFFSVQSFNFIFNLHLNDSLFYDEYAVILIFLFIAILLSVVIVSLSYFLAVQNPETEKLSTYECGFEPYEDARHTFDVKFYLVAILFLIFDLEAAFFFPWCVSLSFLNIEALWGMLEFVIELLFGLYYAWQVGALDWE